MRIDVRLLQPLIDQKLVSIQKHPDFDLYIYNYTQRAQFEKNWTPELKMCRGLILDGEGNVIARPFDKFFNYDEHFGESNLGPIPPTSFKAYDKFDGSLGITYKTPDGKLAIATRGSFVSEQAIEGTKMLQELLLRGEGITDGCTFLYEIIFPSNRIVVDYGTERKLVLLAIRHIESGDIVPIGKPIDDYQTPRDNAEGVVLYYENGFMCKVKYEEYVRLHRLVTRVTARSIWDLLRNHQPIDELLERVPDEFYTWVKGVMGNILKDYALWERVSKEVYDRAIKLPTRKEQALVVKEYSCADIVFCMLDQKPYEPLIWRRLRPPHETPFKKDMDL